MLSGDGEREAGASHSDLSGPCRLPMASRAGPGVAPELRLSEGGLRALAGLLGIATLLDGLEGRRPLPQSTHSGIGTSAPAWPGGGWPGPCRAEVEEWASVDRIDRRHLPTADGGAEEDDRDAWAVLAHRARSGAPIGIGAGGHRAHAASDRILFTFAEGPGAPEVEIGSAWFA